MSGTVEIRMTQRGFDVISATGTTSFADLEQAVRYARDRLQRARDVRELSARIG
jgi:hypothetical protein